MVLFLPILAVDLRKYTDNPSASDSKSLRLGKQN